MSFDINKLYTEICGADVFFSYKGNFTSNRINLILQEVEEKLAVMSINIRLRKKVYNIMVEILQNLFHHSEDIPEDLTEILGKSYGMMIIRKKNQRFSLTAGNFVSSDKVNLLTEKIEKINSLSSEELKEMYKYILKYQKLSPKGGGGLGLIDIARKSEKQLGYKFYPYNEKHCFYRLDIFVSL